MILSKRGRHGKGGPADGARQFLFRRIHRSSRNSGESIETSPEELRELGDSWLPELAPDAKAIEEFETNIGICLSEVVTPCKERIDEILGSAPEDLRQEAWILASAIQHDSSLDYRRREHLYRELISAILESRAKDSAEEPTELSSVLLGAQLSIRTPAPFPPLGSQPGSQTTELRTYRGPGTSHLAIVRHAAVRQILDPASGGRAALVPNANPVRDRVGDLFAIDWRQVAIAERNEQSVTN